jgi:hypothetical protein
MHIFYPVNFNLHLVFPLLPFLSHFPPFSLPPFNIFSSKLHISFPLGGGGACFHLYAAVLLSPEFLYSFFFLFTFSYRFSSFSRFVNNSHLLVSSRYEPLDGKLSNLTSDLLASIYVLCGSGTFRSSWATWTCPSLTREEPPN